mgnify:FL=1
MLVCSGVVDAVLQHLPVVTLHLLVQPLVDQVQTHADQPVLLLAATPVLQPVQLLLHVHLLVQLLLLHVLQLAVHQHLQIAVHQITDAKLSEQTVFVDGAKACVIAVANLVDASRVTTAAVLQ